MQPTCAQGTALAVLSLCLFVAAPSRLLAQACEGEREALSLTQEAREAFREARYEDSRALLTRALALCEQPIIVFNLARVSLETGDLVAARDHYLRYLEMRPDAPDRAEVERRLSSLGESISAQTALERRARMARRRAAEARREAAAARAQAEAAQDDVHVAPGIVGASGLLLLGAGGAFAVAAAVESDVAPEVDHATASRALDTAETYALVANLGFAIGGAAALAFAIWETVILSTRADGPSPSASVRIAPTGVSVTGRF